MLNIRIQLPCLFIVHGSISCLFKSIDAFCCNLTVTLKSHADAAFKNLIIVFLDRSSFRLSADVSFMELTS